VQNALLESYHILVCSRHPKTSKFKT